MPRVREFDPQTVLADATQVFWRNGYADTSMEVIVSQTGVSRYGLYGSFGNEKELLIAAIRHYDETMNQLLMASLQDHEASLPAIIDYCRTIAEHAKDETFCAGCLIVNVAVKVAPHDSDVSAEVQRIDRKHQAFFYAGHSERTNKRRGADSYRRGRVSIYAGFTHKGTGANSPCRHGSRHFMARR